MQLIKAGLMALGIIALTIILIVAIGEWGDSYEARSNKATQEALAMSELVRVMETVRATVNTQQLQITPMLKALYGSENIAGEINKYVPEEYEEI